MGFMYARMKSEVISIQDYGGVLTSWGVRTWGYVRGVRTGCRYEGVRTVYLQGIRMVYLQGVRTVYVRCTYIG